MSYGVTSTGFVVKRFADILASLKARLLAIRDSSGNALSIDTEDSTVLSQMMKITSEQIAEGWEMAGQLATQFDPNYNVGAFQSGTVQLNGILRNSHVPTQIAITATGDDATVVTKGSLVTFDNNPFTVDDAITIEADVKATVLATFSANPADADTITIGRYVYTFKGAIVSAGQVKIGLTLAATGASLVHAINGTGTAGVDYYAGTTASALASASYADSVLTIEAKTAGYAGNYIPVAKSSTAITIPVYLIGASGRPDASITVASVTNIVNDTLTIGDVVYTFKDTPAAANDIDVKPSAAAQAVAIGNAINADGTAGAYGTGTVFHPLVSAIVIGSTVYLTARTAGTNANSLAVSTSFAAISFGPCLDGGTGRYAAGTLIVTALPADATTLTIGGITYLFETSTLDAPFKVDVGLSTDAQALIIQNAINADGTAGAYGAGTYENPYVSAVAIGSSVVLTAKTVGVSGNSLLVDTTSAGITTSGISLANALEYGTGQGYATSTGTTPIAIPDDSDMVVATPISGWVGVTCASTVVAGSGPESDEELRVRQQISTQITAAREAESIVAAVQNVDGVTFAQIYENPTDAVDAKSIPSGGVCVLVVGGGDVAITDAIYSRLSCMTRTFGNAATEYDTISVAFQRPVDVPVAVAVNVKARDANFPVDYADQVKAAIVAWAASSEGYTPGEDVYSSDLYVALHGLTSMYATTLTVGSAGATYATGWINVNSFPANDDTLVLGDGDAEKTYTFKTTLTGAADEIKRDMPNTLQARNIAAAINAGTGAGTYYGTGTTAHTTMTAVRSGYYVLLTAKVAGAAYNAEVIDVSDCTSLESSGGTLSGGTGAQSPGAAMTMEWNQIATFAEANITVTNT
jgi:hypothetical protein